MPSIDSSDDGEELDPPLDQWQREIGEIYIEGYKHYAVDNTTGMELGYVRAGGRWCWWARDHKEDGSTRYARTQLADHCVMRYTQDGDGVGHWLVADRSRKHPHDEPDTHDWGFYYNGTPEPSDPDDDVPPLPAERNDWMMITGQFMLHGVQRYLVDAPGFFVRGPGRVSDAASDTRQAPGYEHGYARVRHAAADDPTFIEEVWMRFDTHYHESGTYSTWHSQIDDIVELVTKTDENGNVFIKEVIRGFSQHRIFPAPAIPQGQLMRLGGVGSWGFRGTVTDRAAKKIWKVYKKWKVDKDQRFRENAVKIEAQLREMTTDSVLQGSDPKLTAALTAAIIQFRKVYDVLEKKMRVNVRHCRTQHNFGDFLVLPDLTIEKLMKMIREKHSPPAAEGAPSDASSDEGPGRSAGGAFPDFVLKYNNKVLEKHLTVAQCGLESGRTLDLEEVFSWTSPQLSWSEAEEIYRTWCINRHGFTKLTPKDWKEVKDAMNQYFNDEWRDERLTEAVNNHLESLGYKIFVLFVNGPHKRQNFDLWVYEDMTVDELKRMIRDEHGVNPSDQRLFLGRTELEEDKTLEHYCINEHKCLKLETLLQKRGR